MLPEGPNQLGPRKHRVPGCCSGRRRNSHSCPMARHGFRLGPTPCRSHASAMPIGVGRHHQTNQSQTKDLTERIADALVSAMCLCIFGKEKRKRLSLSNHYQQQQPLIAIRIYPLPFWLKRPGASLQSLPFHLDTPTGDGAGRGSRGLGAPTSFRR